MNWLKLIGVLIFTFIGVSFLWINQSDYKIEIKRENDKRVLQYIGNKIYIQNYELKTEDGKTYEERIGNSGFIIKVDENKVFSDVDTFGYDSGLWIGKEGYILKKGNRIVNKSYKELGWANHSGGEVLLKDMQLTSYYYEDLFKMILGVLNDLKKVCVYWLVGYIVYYMIHLWIRSLKNREKGHIWEDLLETYVVYSFLCMLGSVCVVFTFEWVVWIVVGGLLVLREIYKNQLREIQEGSQ